MLKFNNSYLENNLFNNITFIEQYGLINFYLFIDIYIYIYKIPVRKHMYVYILKIIIIYIVY